MTGRRGFLGALVAGAVSPASVVIAGTTEPAPDPCGALMGRTTSCVLPVGHEGKHHSIVMGRSAKDGKFQMMREIYW